MLSVITTVAGLVAYIVYDQTVNAPQMHKLEVDSDLLKKVTIGTHTSIFDLQNELVEHNVNTFNAHQELELGIELLLEDRGITISDGTASVSNEIPMSIVW